MHHVFSFFESNSRHTVVIIFIFVILITKYPEIITHFQFKTVYISIGEKFTA